jgi:dipeptidase D
VAHLGDRSSVAIDPAASRRIIDALSAVHHGVFGMHPKVAGLVQTSNNLSILATQRGPGGEIEVRAGTMSRSSSDSRLQNVLDAFSAIGRLSGAKVEFKNHYAGWEPNPDSPLLTAATQVYKRLFTEAPKVAAIHAGLECGIIGERVGGMDMISIGPRIEGAHSPDERVYPRSVAKSWRMLTELLHELSKS